MRNWLVTVLLATALGCLPPATVPEDGQTVVTPRALPRSAEPVRDERADALAKASRMVHAAAATATLESACQPGRAGLLAAQEAALRHEPTRAAASRATLCFSETCQTSPPMTTAGTALCQ